MPVALATLAVVRTIATARIVETPLDCEIIISADIAACSSRSGGRTRREAGAVSVVRSPAYVRVVVAITAKVQSAHVITSRNGISGIETGVTLSINTVSAAVVLVVITGTVYIVTSDISTGIAG